MAQEPSIAAANSDEWTFADEYAKQKQFLFGGNRYWIHIGIWTLLILIAIFRFDWLFITDILFQYKDNTHTLHNHDTPSAWFFVAMFISLLFVYSYLLLVAPYAKYKVKRRYIYGYLILSTVIFYSSLFLLIYMLSMRQDGSVMMASMVQSLIVSSMVGAYFLAVFYFLDIYDKMRPLQQYEALLSETIDAESSLLSSQINPHFLFNTINNIYGLSLTDLPMAHKSITKLEDLIQYMHQDNQVRWIWLQDEIAFINSYIELEQLRNVSKKSRVLFTVDGSVEGFKIAPLILINFIENAFKHSMQVGENTSAITINIRVKDAKIYCYILNTKNSVQRDAIQQQHSGIGIKNVLRRLSLIYNNDFRLKITNSKKVYEVKLILKNYHE